MRGRFWASSWSRVADCTLLLKTEKLSSTSAAPAAAGGGLCLQLMAALEAFTDTALLLAFRESSTAESS
jgi:hypothetical protein